MKITKSWLEKTNACELGVEWYNSKAFKTDKALFSALIEEEKFDWTTWALVRLMSRKQKLQYIIFIAELMLPIFEKKYPEDKRPHAALNTAKIILKNDSKENRENAKIVSNIIHRAYYNYGDVDEAYAAIYTIYGVMCVAAHNTDAIIFNTTQIAYTTYNTAFSEITKFGLKLLGI